MPDNILMIDIIFFVVFLSQILLISFYYPRKALARMISVLETYPPSTYPKLYPKPAKFYENSLLHYRYINSFILAIGLILLSIWTTDSTNDDYAGVVFIYFMIQFIPTILIELGSFRYYKLMRNSDSRTTRRAELQPRHLFDFISPAIIGTALLVYFAFIVLVLYIRQFEFPWFGGFSNIVIITAGNLFFAGIIIWNMFGKKLNPYQAHEDRIREIEIIVKQLVLISIAMTIFASIEIVLNSSDMRHLMQTALSLYFQILAVIGLRTLQIDNLNFEVYKEDALTS